MWNRLAEVGPLYPGVGWEMPLAAVVCVVWLAWTVWQLRHENAEYAERVRQLQGPGEKARESSRGSQAS